MVAPYTPTVKSLKDQVESQFIPGYTGSSPKATWSGADTLFAFWIGINDIGNSYWLENVEELNNRIFAVMTGLVDKVYAAGGRNFVFINVPPLERTPLIAPQGAWAVEHSQADVVSWNQKVVTLAKAVKTKSNTNVWVYDAHKSFGNVMTNPASSSLSAHLKNTTQYCEAYQK